FILFTGSVFNSFHVRLGGTRVCYQRIHSVTGVSRRTDQDQRIFAEIFAVLSLALPNVRRSRLIAVLHGNTNGAPSESHSCMIGLLASLPRLHPNPL
ncbi:hypothetical protein PENTCL1PPCAC_14467, partial [Pristionchus entomophagus]